MDSKAVTLFGLEEDLIVFHAKDTSNTREDLLGSQHIITARLAVNTVFTSTGCRL
jgi:hypothetical protein